MVKYSLYFWKQKMNMVALRLFTTCLNNLAIELDAFIMTATQVSNNDEKTGGFMDFRNVQGSTLALLYLFPFY